MSIRKNIVAQPMVISQSIDAIYIEGTLSEQLVGG